MSREIAEEFQTQAAGWVHMLLLLEEEQRPLPEHPSPAMLVARVTERLGQAAMAVAQVEQDEPPENSLMQVGVFLLGAAAFALTAIAHMVPEAVATAPTALKDSLVEHLDGEVAEALTADKMRTASTGELVRVTLALLVGACQCVAELEGVSALPEDEPDEDASEYTLDELLATIELGSDDGDEDDEWEASLFEQMIDSLGQAATMAAAAGEELIERSER
jgi:hypothetical protein